MRVFCILTVLLVGTAHAAVYKSVNEYGEVVYSDRPVTGAETVTLPVLPSYTPAPLWTRAAPPQPKQERVEYRNFSILDPQSEATIRNNLGEIELSTVLEPALATRQGHLIMYFLDGQPYSKAVAATTLNLADIDRGAHSLSASVLDKEGRVLISTAVITVYVKRNSILHGDRAGTFTENPGFITDNPNHPGKDDFEPYRLKDIVDNSRDGTQELDPEVAEQIANPGYRNRNPNVLSTNPNIISSQPGLVNPPLPVE